MHAEEKNKIEIDTLLEIIYELYKEDIRGGKLRVDLHEGVEQSVGKPAIKAKTFQQTAFIFRK